MSTTLRPEDMAAIYWNRARKASLREVEVKLMQFKHATPNTIRYWLAVHSWLEKRAGITKGKAFHEIVSC